jgi:hypothetical protein
MSLPRELVCPCFWASVLRMFRARRDVSPLVLIMKFLALSFTAIALLMSGCSNVPQADNALSSAEAADGWKLLFDGSSLAGWRGYNGVEIDGAWVTVDGVLHHVSPAEGSAHVNIITEAEYDDFDMRFDWKVEEGTNSGVIFHVGEGPKEPYLTGPEYQVLDNFGFRSGKGLPVGPTEHSASHYAIEAAVSDETKPIGEWNSGQLLVKGDHVEYWLNGVKTAEYEMHSPHWNEQVANSKFKNWEEYATLGKGHIGLQDHGHRVWFRNLKIKEL